MPKGCSIRASLDPQPEQLLAVGLPSERKGMSPYCRPTERFLCSMPSANSTREPSSKNSGPTDEKLAKRCPWPTPALSSKPTLLSPSVASVGYSSKRARSSWDCWCLGVSRGIRHRPVLPPMETAQGQLVDPSGTPNRTSAPVLLGL